jgi:transposase InsO family protein
MLPSGCGSQERTDEFVSTHTVMEEENEDYWVTRVEKRRYRVFADDGQIGLEFKVAWYNSDEKTWVDESAVGEDDTGIVREYIQKNSLKIAREIAGYEALPQNFDNNITFMSKFFQVHLGKCQLFNRVGDQFPHDDLDQEHELNDDDGDEQDAWDAPRTLVPCFRKTISGSGIEVEIDFSREGISLKGRDHIASLFTLQSDEDLFLFSGDVLAAHDTDGRFSFPPVLLGSNATYSICGNIETNPSLNDDEPTPADEVWTSPVPEGEEMLYICFLHACVYQYLTTGIVPGAYLETKRNFKKNAKYRYKIEDGDLYYNRGRRTRKSYPRQLYCEMAPWALVPRLGAMWKLIEKDHRKHHEGHNRAETRLNQHHYLPNCRQYVEYCQKQCTRVCGVFGHMPKGCVQPIITSRPLQLVMFDLFFLPCADATGRNICVLACDHFTKYKWGLALDSKRPRGVAEFLKWITRQEGAAERWHCDNGGEFKNPYIKALMAELEVEKMTHGKALHPQTQGLIERANGVLKKKMLKKGLDLGHSHANADFDWDQILGEALMEENDAPLKVYKGLDAFTCMRNRPRVGNGLSLPSLEAFGVMHKFMHDCQLEQAGKMVIQGDPVRYTVGDVVAVHSTGLSKKLGHVYHPWGARARIHSISERNMFYYKIEWVTVGTRGERIGSVSKKYVPWSCLKMLVAVVVGPEDELESGTIAHCVHQYHECV